MLWGTFGIVVCTLAWSDSTLVQIRSFLSLTAALEPIVNWTGWVWDVDSALHRQLFSLKPCCFHGKELCKPLCRPYYAVPRHMHRRNTFDAWKNHILCMEGRNTSKTDIKHLKISTNTFDVAFSFTFATLLCSINLFPVLSWGICCCNDPRSDDARTALLLCLRMTVWSGFNSSKALKHGQMIWTWLNM